MIETILNEPLALPSNASPITFDETDIRTRCASCCGWLQYMNGGSEFTLIGGGRFKVSFNANVTSDTAGIVALALKSATGTDVEGTEMDATITTAGEESDKAFHFMAKALGEYLDFLHEEADTPQKKQMLNETLQRSMM